MILDLSDGFALRQATEADRPALSLVCLRTGDAGRDATSREDDPELLGLIYALPYQALEPDLAFVVEGGNGVCGYLLGARDTHNFNIRLATEWYPRLRQRIRGPGRDKALWEGSDWARNLIHHPDLKVPGALEAFPSHAHIDLLPEARGRGFGRRVMTFLEGRLADAGSTGLHLQVDPRNLGAKQFYHALGFATLRSRQLPRHTLYVAKRLAEAPDR